MLIDTKQLSFRRSCIHSAQ